MHGLFCSPRLPNTRATSWPSQCAPGERVTARQRMRANYRTNRPGRPPVAMPSGCDRPLCPKSPPGEHLNSLVLATSDRGGRQRDAAASNLKTPGSFTWSTPPGNVAASPVVRSPYVDLAPSHHAAQCCLRKGRSVFPIACRSCSGSLESRHRAMRAKSQSSMHWCARARRALRPCRPSRSHADSPSPSSLQRLRIVSGSRSRGAAEPTPPPRRAMRLSSRACCWTRVSAVWLAAARSSRTLSTPAQRSTMVRCARAATMRSTRPLARSRKLVVYTSRGRLAADRRPADAGAP